MTTEVQKLAQEMLDGLKGVTKGPWFSDGVKSEGGHGAFTAYAVYSEAVDYYGTPASICDTHNAGTITLVQEDDIPWDEQGEKNMAHIARCHPENIALLCRAYLAAVPSIAVEAQARALVEKLEAIHEDPTFQSVWVVNQLHAGPYTGPTYTAELAALQASLASGAKPVAGEPCATDGCERPATCTFERKGVGSRYCPECFGKVIEAVEAKRPTPSPDVAGLEPVAWLIEHNGKIIEGVRDKEVLAMRRQSFDYATFTPSYSASQLSALQGERDKWRAMADEFKGLCEEWEAQANSMESRAETAERQLASERASNDRLQHRIDTVLKEAVEWQGLCLAERDKTAEARVALADLLDHPLVIQEAWADAQPMYLETTVGKLRRARSTLNTITSEDKEESA